MRPTLDPSFETYSNYLEYLAKLMSVQSHSETVAGIAATKAYKRIQAKPAVQDKLVGELLRNAWLTEAVVAAGARSEFASFTQHWAPVQLYYSVYLATRALFGAMNKAVKSEHQATWNTISNEIQLRRELFPSPLCLTLSGKAKAETPDGWTRSEPPRYLNSLVRGQDPLDSVAMLLRTTRRQAIDLHKAAYREDKKTRNVPAKDFARIATNLRPTTLFDCLKRLRINSNYEDVDGLLRSMHDREALAIYANSISVIADRILLVLELLVARYLGKRRFNVLHDEFSSMNAIAYEFSPTRHRLTPQLGHL